MCGITGIYEKNHSLVDIVELRQRASRILHRGPDNIGTYCSNNVALANTRLSIIDIENGDQPFIPGWSFCRCAK